MTAPELHQLFQELTGQKLTASYDRMMTWSQFVARGLTEDDLRLVVRWTRTQISRNEGGFSAVSLQFRAMVADLDRFEDRLNVARQSKLGRATLQRETPSPAPATPAPPVVSPPAENPYGISEEARLRRIEELAALMKNIGRKPIPQPNEPK